MNYRRLPIFAAPRIEKAITAGSTPAMTSTLSAAAKAAGITDFYYPARQVIPSRISPAIESSDSTSIWHFISHFIKGCATTRDAFYLASRFTETCNVSFQTTAV